MGNPVFQIVVPTQFREKVLACSHDKTGHLEVKKNFSHIFRYFFWPRLRKSFTLSSTHFTWIVISGIGF